MHTLPNNPTFDFTRSLELSIFDDHGHIFVVWSDGGGKSFYQLMYDLLI